MCTLVEKVPRVKMAPRAAALRPRSSLRSCVRGVVSAGAIDLSARRREADREENLAKRMRRHGRRPDLVECRRKFRLARHRTLHLVPEGRARPLRGKLSRTSSVSSPQRGAKLPEVPCVNRDGCPWNSRAEFAAARESAEMKALRRFLVDTIDLQAQFLVQRLAVGPPENARRRARRRARRHPPAIRTRSQHRAGMLRSGRLC